jgi:hypothetical protein
MGTCAYSDTVPRPGDDVVVLLRKLLQALGETWDCGDREWQLTASLLTHYGGTPRPGDSVPDLWAKLLRALGDDACHCGDWQWDSMRRVLLQLDSTAFRAGDSHYNILWKMLVAADSGPTPPVPDPPTFWDSASSPFTVATQSPLVNYPEVDENDILLAVFSTNSIHNTSGTPPNGWAKLDEVDQPAVDQSGSVFWKRATASEPASETWTNIFDATEIGLCVVVAYRGCITTGSPVDVSTASAGNFQIPVTIGPVVTTVPQCRVVGIITNDPQTVTQFFTWNDATPRIDLQSPSAAAQIVIGDTTQATPGSISLSGFWDAADTICKFLYALKPQPL